MQAITLAALGTGFTFLMTAAGAAVVLAVRRQTPPLLEQLFLGFAAGVMTASSVWSLLLPAIEMAPGAAWLPAAFGVCAGALVLAVADVRAARRAGGQTGTLAWTAMTLHNIPEGMAVGLACAMSAADGALTASAAALALGVGLQNFPEGAAAALPLRRSGMSRARSFLLGAGSGLAEPAGGVLAVCAAGLAQPVLPWLLSFAAGAMLYVVTKELIPGAVGGGRRAAYLGTAAVVFGFVLMMALDVALG